ncbi:MAG: MFS transporter [Candidatus Niyogibacteria bacterium]|nr:MFS transporter [Candidatus Niyogibacteria bacterium]
MISKVVKIMVLSDFVFNSALGSFGPVFAIFLTDKITGGNAEVVGFSVAVYWVVKSIFQLPIARFLDKTDGEKDDFYALFTGYILASISVFLFIFAKTPLHIYLIQAFFGIVMAIAVPAWYGIFTRHIDDDKTSFEWSLESVFSVGLATAISGAIGGIIVTKFGFNVLFVCASAFSFLSAFSLLFLYPHLTKKTASKITMADVKNRQQQYYI